MFFLVISLFDSDVSDTLKYFKIHNFTQLIYGVLSILYNSLNTIGLLNLYIFSPVSKLIDFPEVPCKHL